MVTVFAITIGTTDGFNFKMPGIGTRYRFILDDISYFLYVKMEFHADGDA